MRILLVEDNRDILANMADYLQIKGYTVDCAQDGLGGLHLALTNSFDLIVLDLMLPGMDGYTVCKRLREDADRTRQRTLEQARLMLAHGKSQDEVLSFLANTLTNRLIHAPSQRLRDAAETGDGEVIETIADIYRLDQPHD